ncbi:MAG: aspartate/glutamate racemase family protein [Endozoicomonas sp.]
MTYIRKPGGEAVIKTGVKLQELGCQCIALLCTGMATAVVRNWLEVHVSIPVIDPVVAAAEETLQYFG